VTKNQRYEQKLKEQGLVKRTVWMPSDCECELKQIIQFCVENRDFIPAMARSIKTGHLKKAVD